MMSAIPLLLALATVEGPPPSVDVVLIRHAEAAAEPQPDPGLSDDGRARVACLVKALHDEKLTHVLSSPFRRAQETAGPLAADHGLEAQARDPLDARALASEIAALPAGSKVLVVGHSNTLPALVTALGGGLQGLVEERGQPALPRDQFDRLVRLTVRSSPPDEASRLAGLQDARQPCPAPRPD